MVNGLSNQSLTKHVLHRSSGIQVKEGWRSSFLCAQIESTEWISVDIYSLYVQYIHSTFLGGKVNFMWLVRGRGEACMPRKPCKNLTVRFGKFLRISARSRNTIHEHFMRERAQLGGSRLCEETPSKFSWHFFNMFLQLCFFKMYVYVPIHELYMSVNISN